MKRKMRVGIVGCGGIARQHLKGYLAAGAKVAVVYDVAPKAAESFAGEAGAEVAGSLSEMAEQCELDAVSICTPPGVHCENCRPFLKAKVAILCEKPLEADARTAARLAAAIKKSRTPFMIAFCHRFHPPILELKKLIRKGVLGKPLLMRNIFGGFRDIRLNHRSNRALAGGGTMIDNNSHSVDLFRFLVGDPTHVSAVIGNLVQKIPVEDFAMMHLEVRGRAFGEITSSMSFRVGGNWVEWYGTKGTAVVSYGNVGHPDLAYELGGSAEWAPVDCSKLPQRFPAEIAHFLECVRKVRKPAVTVDDALKASKILSAAYKSAAEGRRIGLKL